ncbi:MAG: hypothetical protein J6386_09515 [Candidatus Synoicihabitans palmerolidicus]|nr:hypothetical protein [Candidatus Synoicihabitans palmerolidicus]
MSASADRAQIRSDGKDLSFITVRVTDKARLTITRAHPAISFRIEGHGEIVATDNGDPSNLNAFPSTTRHAFNGLALVIVRSLLGHSGPITVTDQAENLTSTQVGIQASDSTGSMQAKIE